MIVLWLILAVVVRAGRRGAGAHGPLYAGAAPAVPEGEETIDRDKAVENLRTLIRCRTVSNTNHALEDDAEFEKLINTLPTLYPNVFKTCKFERLEDRGLLFTWSGKEHTEPTVLMAHYDVVDVDEAGWKKPPFDAVLEDGVVWGPRYARYQGHLQRCPDGGRQADRRGGMSPHRTSTLPSAVGRKSTVSARCISLIGLRQTTSPLRLLWTRAARSWRMYSPASSSPAA